MRAGTLNKRARFEALVRVPDGAGGYTEEWQPAMTVWAGFSPERARERIQAGRIETAFAGVLRIRSSTQAREITQQHRVTVDGVTYGIKSNANPDQRNDMLEFSVEAE